MNQPPVITSREIFVSGGIAAVFAQTCTPQFSSFFIQHLFFCGSSKFVFSLLPPSLSSPFLLPFFLPFSPSLLRSPLPLSCLSIGCDPTQTADSRVPDWLSQARATLQWHDWCRRKDLERGRYALIFYLSSSIARDVADFLGFWGFYRGSAANYLKVIPMQATSFLIYDTLKKQLNF